MGSIMLQYRVRRLERRKKGGEIHTEGPGPNYHGRTYPWNAADAMVGEFESEKKKIGRMSFLLEKEKGGPSGETTGGKRLDLPSKDVWKAVTGTGGWIGAEWSRVE